MTNVLGVLVEVLEVPVEEDEVALEVELKVLEIVVEVDEEELD